MHTVPPHISSSLGPFLLPPRFAARGITRRSYYIHVRLLNPSSQPDTENYYSNGINQTQPSKANISKWTGKYLEKTKPLR